MKRIYDFIGKLEIYLTGILLIIMVIFVFMAGVSRSLRNPIYWANPLASFLFAWAAMFAMDVAYRQNKLMSVDILVKRFPEKIQRYIRIFNYVVIFAFLIYLIFYGIKLSFIMKYRTFEGMYGFSYMWATLSVPVGATLLGITTIVKIVEEVQNLRSGRK